MGKFRAMARLAAANRRESRLRIHPGLDEDDEQGHKENTDRYDEEDRPHSPQPNAPPEDRATTSVVSSIISTPTSPSPVNGEAQPKGDPDSLPEKLVTVTKRHSGSLDDHPIPVTIPHKPVRGFSQTLLEHAQKRPANKVCNLS